MQKKILTTLFAVLLSTTLLMAQTSAKKPHELTKLILLKMQSEISLTNEQGGNAYQVLESYFTAKAALLARRIDRGAVLVERHGMIDPVIGNQRAALHGGHKLSAKPDGDRAIGDIAKVVVQDCGGARRPQRDRAAGISEADAPEQIILDCRRTHHVGLGRIDKRAVGADRADRGAIDIDEGIALDGKALNAAVPVDRAAANVPEEIAGHPHIVGVADINHRRYRRKGIRRLAIMR